MIRLERSMANFNECNKAWLRRLEPALVQRLDTVSRIEMGFPHDLFATEMVRSFVSGGMRDRIDTR